MRATILKVLAFIGLTLWAIGLAALIVKAFIG
jgi:hypothetical protein